MNQTLIEDIREFVEDECKKPTSKYGYEPYPFHFVPVVKYAQILADELGGDKEVITIAAWLHDIGSIVEGREKHHLSGAKIAEKILAEKDYPKDKIELVKKCILNHRGSINNERVSLEEQILAEADAMSNLDNISGIFKAAFIYENLTQGEAKKAVREKMQNKFNQLHLEESKSIIRPKYEAAMLLLN